MWIMRNGNPYHFHVKLVLKVYSVLLVLSVVHGSVTSGEVVPPVLLAEEEVSLTPTPVTLESINLKDSSWDGGLKDEFGKDDLVDLVKELERDAQEEEQGELIPVIMHDFLEGAVQNGKTERPITSSGTGNDSEIIMPPEYFFMSKSELEGQDEDDWSELETDSDDLDDDEEDDDAMDMESKSDPEDRDDERNLPDDLSDLPEDIAEDITAGVVESLHLFDDVGMTNSNGTRDAVETRQLSMYLFQGQYVSEPRLNRFIDGAFRNMGTEMRISSMDPLYFRVLPRGRVVQRGQGQGLYGKKKKGGVRRRRPGKRGRRDTFHVEERSAGNVVPNEARGRFSLRGRKRSQKAKLRRQRLRRKRLRAKRRRLKRCRKNKRCRRKVRQGNKKNRRRQKKKNKRKRKRKKNRFRRRVKQNVGGGRVEGLSNVQRDADAEMQLFGNYTLIRSHMKIGPVELTMQFRTKKGIRRTGATLPFILAHTVTRVNHEGSEMVDFLLDRPHPEMIRVRGNLFNKAQNIAKNIFSRLFLPDSFLVQRMREKTALALLSKPIDSP